MKINLGDRDSMKGMRIRVSFSAGFGDGRILDLEESIEVTIRFKGRYS